MSRTPRARSEGRMVAWILAAQGKRVVVCSAKHGPRQLILGRSARRTFRRALATGAIWKALDCVTRAIERKSGPTRTSSRLENAS